MLRRHGIRTALIIFCLTTWLSSESAVTAQGLPNNWQPLFGPGGRITHLTMSPDGQELYAVSIADVNRRDDQTQWYEAGRLYRADAIYHSTDAGATWRPTTNDLPPGPITALYLDPREDVLYAAIQSIRDEFTGYNTLWRSDADKMLRDWEPVTLDRNDLLIRRVVRNANGNSLLLGAINAGEKSNSYVYSQVASGQWTSTQALSFDQRPGSILADLIPHPTIPGRLFITTIGGDLFVSEDAGQSWTLAQVSTGQASASAAVQLAFRPDRPNSALLVRNMLGVRAGSSDIRVEQSLDGGVRWSPLTTSGLPAGGEARALAALPGNVYLLNTTAGTFRSIDGGASWQPLEGALSSGGVTTFLTLTGGSPTQTRTVLAATGYGVFISRDAGAIWQPLGTGLPYNSKIAGLLTHPARPGQVFAISDNRTSYDPARPPVVLRSLDGGTRWAPAAQNLPDAPITAWAIDPRNPDTLLLASAEGVFRSTNAGASWQVTSLAASPRTAIVFAPSDTNIVYLAGLPAARSTDGGATWREMPIPTTDPTRQTETVNALAVHPEDAQHLWAGLTSEDTSRSGVYESQDGGRTWRMLGSGGRPARWLAAVSGSATGLALYAGVIEDGIYRWDGSSWVATSSGLPAKSTMLAFAADMENGVFWATRDGGGIYRSADAGATWTNASVGVGDNLAQALAINYAEPGAVLIGTAAAGIWTLTSGVQLTPLPRAGETPAGPTPASRAGVDARIEIVWPHDWTPVAEAQLANIGLRLFAPGSLLQPACGWQPRVTVWRAVNTQPAAPLAVATQRSVDGQPFPYWELNDVPVGGASQAGSTGDPGQKLYFLVRVEGVETATSIWAHGADPRTYLPQPEVPSGIATGTIDAVDARIQIVWPHDGVAARAVTEASLVNVSVTFFKHGTRLSVPPGWRPNGISLYGAWNQEVGKPLTNQAEVVSRQAGAITYPTWEFNNIPVARAIIPGNKLYLWVNADGVQTYPTIWAHGADSRTFFPIRDEPIQGCVP